MILIHILDDHPFGKLIFYRLANCKPFLVDVSFEKSSVWAGKHLKQVIIQFLFNRYHKTKEAGSREGTKEGRKAVTAQKGRHCAQKGRHCAEKAVNAQLQTTRNHKRPSLHGKGRQCTVSGHVMQTNNIMHNQTDSTGGPGTKSQIHKNINVTSEKISCED